MRFGLGGRILVGMLVGAGAGALLGERVTRLQPIGDLFIRLLVLAAVPLVFFNLLAGVTALTDVRTLGRVAAKIATYFVLTTILAVLLGLAAMSVLRPGVGVSFTPGAAAPPGDVPGMGDVMLDLLPANAVQAFAGGNVAQIVMLAVLLGIATLFLPTEPRDRLIRAYSLVTDLFRTLVDLILIVAPVGIGVLMAVTAGRYGAQLVGSLATFVLGVWGAQLVMVGVYAVLLRVLTDRAPLAFLRETGAVWVTAMSTTSSLAALPVALEQAERAGLPRWIYSFTLPLGAQVNKDGTAIMLAAVLVFTAQAAGVELATGQIGTVLLLGLILSAGSGGVPSGGLVVALILVRAFGLPLEVAAIVGGIYRLVDMGNTTVNVMGDMIGTAIVAHSETRRAARMAGASAARNG
jgi:Na+/H+-dicarboxylate symporter